MRITEDMRACSTCPRAMRVRIRHPHVDPALAQMAAMQLLGQIRLNQHPSVANTKTGRAHRARPITPELVDFQAERLSQERQRSLDIVVRERRIDIHERRRILARRPDALGKWHHARAIRSQVSGDATASRWSPPRSAVQLADSRGSSYLLQPACAQGLAQRLATTYGEREPVARDSVSSRGTGSD